MSMLKEPVDGDRELLGLVIENPITNAIKFSPDRKDIEVVGGSGGGYARLSVRDYGLGVPPDELPRLFEKFYRASTSIGIAGTGVGLRLVKDVIELHGGLISVESEVGAGSVFTVSLPMAGAKNTDLDRNGATGASRPTGTCGPLLRMDNADRNRIGRGKD